MESDRHKGSIPCIVDPRRLIQPQNTFREAFPELSFRESFNLETRGEPIVVTDPCYLADVYNSSDDAGADYVRRHGVILFDFGGDVSGPIWWQPPFLVLLVSGHEDPTERELPSGAQVLCQEIGCDSGSFVFLPVDDKTPTTIRSEIELALADQNAALVALPAGRYSFFYEQFDAPQPNMTSMFRNIVAKIFVGDQE